MRMFEALSTYGPPLYLAAVLLLRWLAAIELRQAAAELHQAASKLDRVARKNRGNSKS